MRTSILALSMLAVGCGSHVVDDHILRTDFVDYRSPHIEDEFVPYVQKFSQVYSRQVSMLIEWDTLDETTMGICYSWTDGHREIKIDKVKWPGLTDEGKEQLLFHELGHCVFNLPHDPNLMDKDEYTQIPESIMYPYVFGDMPWYVGLKQYYYDQLVNNGK